MDDEEEESMTGILDQYIGDWEAHVSLGHYTGIFEFNKFGQNPVVNTTPEDLWPLGGVHTDLTTGTTLNITSDDAGDTQVIRVTGLDANWNLQVVDVTLTGTTPAQIGDALGWTSVFRMVQVSAAPACTGDLYATVDGAGYTAGVPDNVADVQAYADFGSITTPRSTQQLWGVVPAGYNVIIYDYSAEIETSGGTTRSVEAFLMIAELAKGAQVHAPTWAPYRMVHDLTLSTAASVHDTMPFKMPLVYGPLTRVSLRATASSNSVVGGHITAVLLPQ